MPRCLPVATKWNKPGPSSTSSKMRGRRKKTRRSCAFIPPDRGVRTKPTNFSPVTAAPGGDYENEKNLNSSVLLRGDCQFSERRFAFFENVGRSHDAQGFEHRSSRSR